MILVEEMTVHLLKDGQPLIRQSPHDAAGCYSSIFSVQKVNYSKICGKMKSYQKGSPSAFGEVNSPSSDTRYVEGVSITGNLHSHVWTYTVGLSDDGTYGGGVHSCPCAN